MGSNAVVPNDTAQRLAAWDSEAGREAGFDRLDRRLSPKRS